MLPYETVDEASAALGRPLTALETLWFDYSATKSDYFLHCHSILFFFFITVCTPPFYLLLEHLSDKNKMLEYKIQPKVVKLSLKENLRGFGDLMHMFILVDSPILLLSYPLVKMLGIRTSLPLPSVWEILAQLVVYFIVEDYVCYWIHRLLHCNKWAYENIHRVHHEVMAPTVYTVGYAKWSEIVAFGIPTIVGPAVAPGHIITFWFWLALRLIESFETHSGYDFPWSPTRWIPFYGGAKHHDYHHYVGGQCQSNFASVFTYCDYIYGTDKGYRYQMKTKKELKDRVKSIAGLQNGGSYNASIDYKSD